MIKKLLSIAFVFSGILVSAQSFTATYSFAATTTISGTTDPSTPPSATGLTFGSFSAVGTPSANPNASGRFSFVGWPTGALTGTTSVDTYSTMTGALNPSEYYEVTLTPTSGNTISLTTITFGVRRSGTGIRNYAVRSSSDAYAANLPASVGTNTNLSVVGNNAFFWNFDATPTSSDQTGSTITLSGGSFTNFTSPITFRFYGWNSEASGGTFSIDNVTFNGSATSIPTGVKEISTSPLFSVFPNPNAGHFTIQSSVFPATVAVFDIAGRQVLSKQITETETVCDLSQFDNGIYHLNIATENKISNHKIILTK